MTATDIGLLAAGVVAVGAGLLAVTSRLLLHAVSMAVVAALGVAACCALLGADAAGGLYLLTALLSAGALLVVSLATTRGPLARHDDFDVSWGRRAGGAVVGAAATLGLAVALARTFTLSTTVEVVHDQSGFARALLGPWGWATLVTSVVVVLSLVAAAELARREVEE